MKHITYKRLLLSSLILIMYCMQAKAEIKPVQIDLSQTSVSGLSSGGFMATQFHIAHSETIIGAGVVAAGPYYCAKGSLTVALGECINQVPENFGHDFMTHYDNFQKQGLIAPKSTMQNDKVWLLHGSLDTRIIRPVNNALYAQYQQIVSSDNVHYVTDQAFAHLMPTRSNGGDCKRSESPFIGNCKFDAAGEILQYIHGTLQTPLNNEQTAAAGKLITFEQASLAKLDSTQINDAGMHKNGFAYVPKSCNEGQDCTVHISFHGCNQSIDNVNNKYASLSGFNNWAASNHIIVLYPQVEKSSFMPMNPQACWDWWGYTSADYANKNGKQIKVVYSMLENLAILFNNEFY